MCWEKVVFGSVSRRRLQQPVVESRTVLVNQRRSSKDPQTPGNFDSNLPNKIGFGTPKRKLSSKQRGRYAKELC